LYQGKYPAVKAGTDVSEWETIQHTKEDDLKGSLLLFKNCPELVLVDGMPQKVGGVIPCWGDDRHPDRFVGHVDSAGKATAKLTLKFDSASVPDGLHDFRFVATSDANAPSTPWPLAYSNPIMDVVFHVMNDAKPDAGRPNNSLLNQHCEAHCGAEMPRHRFRSCINGCRKTEGDDFEGCLLSSVENKQALASNAGCAYMYGIQRGLKSSRASCTSTCKRAATTTSQSSLFTSVCTAFCEAKMQDSHVGCVVGHAFQAGICQNMLDEEHEDHTSSFACMTGCSIGAALYDEKKGLEKEESGKSEDVWSTLPPIIDEQMTDDPWAFPTNEETTDVRR
jgi:hypothetical protein